MLQGGGGTLELTESSERAERRGKGREGRGREYSLKSSFAQVTKWVLYACNPNVNLKKDQE